MLKVGLTGGIGCGKSTVARLFEKLSVPVIDADVIAHQLVDKGHEALQQIERTFGRGVLQPDGSLDRPKLKSLIFGDSSRKKQLEAILHPLVYRAIQNQIEKLAGAYCIVCIPLLFETEMTAFVDRILVVDCPERVQLERVKNRDHLDENLIQSIIAAQVSRTYRKSRADDLIDNSGVASSLAEQVKNLHNLYLSLSN